MGEKHSLVIGGTRGIGRALVKNWAEEGHILSVIGRRQPSETDRQWHGVYYSAIDLFDHEKLMAVLTEIIRKNGRLDNLVFFQRYRGEGDDWAGEIELNLTVTKAVIERLTEEFKKEGEKSIVVISSAASELILKEQPLSYHIAKAGQNQMVRYFAVNLAPRGIRVNAVSPAIVMKEEAKDFYLQNEKLHSLYKTITPLGRMGRSEDIANATAFLCSEKASFITGQNIVVDGGLSLQSQQSLARKLCPET